VEVGVADGVEEDRGVDVDEGVTGDGGREDFNR
jgi:hypothetical protein